MPLTAGSGTMGDDSEERYQHSGTLESYQKDSGILMDRDGEKHSIILTQWTLACRRDNLINHIRSIKGQREASEVIAKLQQAAFTLTSERKINTALAKDQLERLQNIMEEKRLFTFCLPLPSATVVRASQRPLIVGN